MYLGILFWYHLRMTYFRILSLKKETADGGTRIKSAVQLHCIVHTLSRVSIIYGRFSDDTNVLEK